MGHVRGCPVFASKPVVVFNKAASTLASPHVRGGERISASTHGAFVKYGSSAGHSFPAGCTHTCTFDNPEMPTWA